MLCTNPAFETDLVDRKQMDMHTPVSIAAGRLPPSELSCIHGAPNTGGASTLESCVPGTGPRTFKDPTLLRFQQRNALRRSLNGVSPGALGPGQQLRLSGIQAMVSQRWRYTLSPPSRENVDPQLCTRDAAAAQAELPQAHSMPAKPAACAAAQSACARQPTQAGASIPAHPPQLLRYLQTDTPSPSGSVASCREPRAGDSPSMLPLSPIPASAALQPLPPPPRRQSQLRASQLHAFDAASEVSASWDLTAVAPAGVTACGAAPLPGNVTPEGAHMSPQDAISAAVARASESASASRPGSAVGSSASLRNHGRVPPSPGLTCRASELSWRLSGAESFDKMLQTPTASPASPSDRRGSPLFHEASDCGSEAPSLPLRMRYSAIECVPADDMIVDVSYAREHEVQYEPLRRKYGARWYCEIDESVSAALASQDDVRHGRTTALQAGDEAKQPPAAAYVGDSADFEQLQHAPSAWRTLNSVQYRKLMTSSADASACTTPDTTAHDTCQLPFSVPPLPEGATDDAAEQASRSASADASNSAAAPAHSPPIQALPSAAALLAVRHAEAASASLSCSTSLLRDSTDAAVSGALAPRVADNDAGAPSQLRADVNMSERALRASARTSSAGSSALRAISPTSETIGLCSDGACFAAAHASTDQLAPASTSNAGFADDSFDPGAGTSQPPESTCDHSCAAGLTPPLDTPDRALLAAQLLNTPEPSPDVSLRTCGFGTSTVDESVVRPTPMMHSPRPIRTLSPPTPSSTQRPTPADPRAPRPQLPATSMSHARLGRYSAAMRSSAACSTTAGAQQSIADVRFCGWDDPQLQRAALSVPAPVDTHDPPTPSTDVSTGAEAACVPEAATSPEGASSPVFDSTAGTSATFASAARTPHSALQDSTPLSVRGSYCAAYKETWREAMQAYVTAKRRTPKKLLPAPPAATPPPHPGEVRDARCRPLQPAQLRVDLFDLASPTRPGAMPCGAEPSPADSAAGWARALPPSSPCDTLGGASSLSFAPARASPSRSSAQLPSPWARPETGARQGSAFPQARSNEEETVDVRDATAAGVEGRVRRGVTWGPLPRPRIGKGPYDAGAAHGKGETGRASRWLPKRVRLMFGKGKSKAAR